MDKRNWEQIYAGIALHETNRELESQRLELYQANQWADQGQRERVYLFGELEMRNRIFQEKSRKRLPRNCGISKNLLRSNR